jgi:hypothetical protein
MGGQDVVTVTSVSAKYASAVASIYMARGVLIVFSKGQ